MTIPNSNNRDSYNGNGATTTFAFTFKLFEKSHLVAVLTEDSTELSTTLVLDTDYEIADDQLEVDGGGNITTMADGITSITGETIIPEGWTLTLTRSVPLEQATDLENQGSWQAETVEKMVDYNTMRIIQLGDTVENSLRGAQGPTGATGESALFTVTAKAFSGTRAVDSGADTLLPACSANTLINASFSSSNRFGCVILPDASTITAGRTVTVKLRSKILTLYQSRINALFIGAIGAHIRGWAEYLGEDGCARGSAIVLTGRSGDLFTTADESIRELNDHVVFCGTNFGGLYGNENFGYYISAISDNDFSVSIGPDGATESLAGTPAGYALVNPLILECDGDFAEFVCDGTNWILVNSKALGPVYEESNAFALNGLGGSGRFAMMSGGSAELKVGTWELEYSFHLEIDQADSVVQLNAESGLYAAPGANSATTPTLLSSLIGAQVIDGLSCSGSLYIDNVARSHPLAATSDFLGVVARGKCLLQLAYPRYIYAVPKISYAGISANSKVKTYIYGRRLA